MAYILQAIVTLDDDIQSQLPSPLRSITLDAGLKMVPLGDDAKSHFGIPVLPLIDEGEKETPLQIHQLCEQLSQGRALAYIEAEFFGGAGTQACVLFNDGKSIDSPIISETAINHALHILGISKKMLMMNSRLLAWDDTEILRCG